MSSFDTPFGWYTSPPEKVFFDNVRKNQYLDCTILRVSVIVTNIEKGFVPTVLLPLKFRLVCKGGE